MSYVYPYPCIYSVCISVCVQKQILAALDKNRRAQACLDLLAAFLRTLPSPAPTGRRARSSLRSSPTPPPPPIPVSSPRPPSPEGTGRSQSESGHVGGGGGGNGGEGGNGARRSETDLARALVGVAKLLHDSLDLLSSAERQRQVSTGDRRPATGGRGEGGGLGCGWVGNRERGVTKCLLFFCEKGQIDLPVQH